MVSNKGIIWLFPYSLMKNRIVVKEKVQTTIEHLYFFLAFIYILSKKCLI